ncbi:MAG: PEGA domain-containing protein [Methanoregula sp.]|nr:PEGA domain-containing protein [Methanoregula sp.]
MSRKPSLLSALALCLIVAGIVSAGCSSTSVIPPQETGSVQVTSVPPGAEIYLDNEYRGTTPATITGVPAGSHTAGIRMSGYEPWAAPVAVTKGTTAPIQARLVSIPDTLPVTFATAAIPEAGLPQIHVDGYWTYPEGRSSTENPVPLVVHTEAFNVGSAGAREVQASANFYYEGRMVCWNTVYLGTLFAGGHVSRDTMVSCTLPSPLSDQALEVRFENVVVTP